MKKSFIAIFFIIPIILFGQFKSQNKQPSFSRDLGIRLNSSTSILGFLDLSRIQMYNSYSFSMVSNSQGNFGYGIYRNTIFYPISKSLQFQGDIYFMSSLFGSGQGRPFGSSSSSPGFLKNRMDVFYNMKFQYRPFPNSVIQLSFRNLPTFGQHGLLYRDYLQEPLFWED
jgi:hypothetical protein